MLSATISMKHILWLLLVLFASSSALANRRVARARAHEKSSCAKKVSGLNAVSMHGDGRPHITTQPVRRPRHVS